MLALRFDAKPFLDPDYPRPSPEPGEALIRVLRTGICRTDLEILKGYMGFKGVLGHEFVGVVEQAGDPSLIGRRVGGEINLPCRHCQTCHAGMPNHCPFRTVLGISGKDGVFAEYVTLPVANLHHVPDGVSDASAAFVEPLAAACRIMEQVRFVEDERVAILGDGKLGLLIAEVLGQRLKRVTLFGKHPEKMALVRDRVRTGTATSAPNRAFDVVVEASGSPGGLSQAAKMVRPNGIIVLKSTCAAGAEFNAAPFVIDEVTVIGSRCGPFDKAIELLETGAVNVEKFITATYPLSAGMQALEHARNPGSLKIQLEMGRRQ